MIHHEPAPSKDEPEFDLTAPSRSARLGMKLFVIYAVFYLGFVLSNAFAPQLMERTPIGGLNIAIIYGFALIIVAFVLAIVYGILCREPTAST